MARHAVMMARGDGKVQAYTAVIDRGAELRTTHTGFGFGADSAAAATRLAKQRRHGRPAAAATDAARVASMLRMQVRPVTY